jgi:metal-sulfur cluster biosynthetic enzyme
VKMTLTPRAAAWGQRLPRGALEIMSVPGCDATVDLVWDPPWNQDMISEPGK